MADRALIPPPLIMTRVSGSSFAAARLTFVHFVANELRKFRIGELIVGESQAQQN